MLLAVVGSKALAQEHGSGAGMPEPSDILVTNVFFDTYILDALSDLSLDSGIPILADTTVGGFVTLELFDVPLPQAIEQLVLPGGYTYKWIDGILGLVGPAGQPTLSRTFSN